jgi:hypothetical protein
MAARVEIGVVDGDDVGVVQAGRSAGLAGEALHRVGAGFPGGEGENLDGYRAIQPQILTVEDHAHPAGADARAQAIVAEHGAGRQKRFAGGSAVGREKLTHVVRELGPAGARLVERRGTLFFRELAQPFEEISRLAMKVGSHARGDGGPPRVAGRRRLNNHARAICHSRITVDSEMLSTEAISLFSNPPK